MRVSDIFLAVPQIILAIAIAQTLGPSIENVILALSATYWPFWARLVYAETRSALTETYVEASIALGASPMRVMLMHVLPNISSSIIVRTTIGMGGTILTAAALGFLGLGLRHQALNGGGQSPKAGNSCPRRGGMRQHLVLPSSLLLWASTFLVTGCGTFSTRGCGEAMMAEPLLIVDELEVAFATDKGLARVLDKVNFSIDAGEIVGLVGESGCGKTTLARSILGILPANSARILNGSIRFEGRDLLTVNEADLASDFRGRVVTFVPQDPFSSFNPVFTIGSQIMELMKWKSPDAGKRGVFGRYNQQRREADYQRIIQLMQTVQLPDAEGILRKYPHEVSGGQRQRLMIAMALLPEPRLIIADEPTTALDVTIQAQILKLLRQLAREREVAVLFTTHDLGSAYEICDRITVMYAGQEAESAAAERFLPPHHLYPPFVAEPAQPVWQYSGYTRADTGSCKAADRLSFSSALPVGRACLQC